MTVENIEICASFLLEEYKSLRNQIDYQIKEDRDLERYAMIGIGLVYAWLANVQNPSHMIYPAWLFPPLIAFLGMLRARSMARRLDQLSTYVRKIEEEFFDRKGLGWENHLSKARARKKSPGLGKSRRIYWSVLILFSILASAYGFVCHVWKAVAVGV
jgi:hypothetical protein